MKGGITMLQNIFQFGLEAGVRLTAEEVAKNGWTEYWGEGGLKLVIDGQHGTIYFQVMTPAEYNDWLSSYIPERPRNRREIDL